MTAPTSARHGSTVYAGGYECECFDCYERRRIGCDGNVATWSSWRIRGRGLATWILCDECLPKSRALDEAPTSVDDPNVAHLYLPLLSPAKPARKPTDKRKTTAIDERSDHPIDKHKGATGRDGIKLHRIHASPNATQLHVKPLGMMWRAEGGATKHKVDVAYRLALAWNLCEGIPTEALEQERGFFVELVDAIEAGDLAKAREVLARMDAGVDRTDGRLHDCKQCLRDASDEGVPDDEEIEQP